MENPLYKVGDKVWVYIPAVKQGQSRKFTHKWYGPFTIEEILSPVNFKLSNPQGKHIHDVVHAQRLKLYTDPMLRPTNTVNENEEEILELPTEDMLFPEQVKLVDVDGNSLLDIPESVSSPTEKHHKVTVNTPAIVLNTDDGVEKILRTETRWDHGVLKPYYLVKWNGIEESIWVSADDLTAPTQIQQFQEEENRLLKKKSSQESRKMGADPPIYEKSDKRRIRPVNTYINQILASTTARNKSSKVGHKGKKK